MIHVKYEKVMTWIIHITYEYVMLRTSRKPITHKFAASKRSWSYCCIRTPTIHKTSMNDSHHMKRSHVTYESQLHVWSQLDETRVKLYESQLHVTREIFVGARKHPSEGVMSRTNHNFTCDVTSWLIHIHTTSTTAFILHWSHMNDACHTHTWNISHMGWLWLVGSLQIQVALQNSLFYRALLRKKPVFFGSLLMVATPQEGVKSRQSQKDTSFTQSKGHVTKTKGHVYKSKGHVSHTVKRTRHKDERTRLQVKRTRHTVKRTRHSVKRTHHTDTYLADHLNHTAAIAPQLRCNHSCVWACVCVCVCVCVVCKK